MKKIRVVFVAVVFLIAIAGSYVYLDKNYYPAVLMYHHIDEELAGKDTIAVSPQVFSRQMDFISRRNYQVVSAEELCGMIKTGARLPRNLVAITFDDGYRNNLKAVKALRNTACRRQFI